MNNSNRDTILWVGEDLPAYVQEVTALLGLKGVATQIDKIDPAAVELFGVLISMAGVHSQKALVRLSRLLRSDLLEYGALVGIVTRPPPSPSSSAHRQEAVEVQRRVAEAVARKAGTPFAREGPSHDELVLLESIRVIEPQPAELARELRSHKTGPAANPRLIIDNSKCKGGLRDCDRILLRRAFSDWDRIVLEELTGGRSEECCVWMVSAFKGNVCYQQFVAKAGKRLALQSEFDTFRDFVRDGIGFPFRAPFLESQFVKGRTRAILVSMHVPRSHRFDEYLASAGYPELVISSLFHVALGAWREAVTLSQHTIGHAYIEEQRAWAATDNAAYGKPVPALLPDPTRLGQAFNDAKKLRASVPSPEQVWEMLEQAGPPVFHNCQSHGDLNVRNIFVRWNSPDVILIDFSHSSQYSRARDPAKLDTSIALTVGDSRNQLLSAKVLKELYHWPLIPARQVAHSDGRTRAIRQIRRLAGGDGITNAEYAILIACHLLKYAAQPASVARKGAALPKRRALCYLLACRLLEAQREADARGTN